MTLPYLHRPHDSGPPVGARRRRATALRRRAPRAAVFMYTCHGTCAPEHTLPDLASVVPAPRFAATMGHDLRVDLNPLKKKATSS